MENNKIKSILCGLSEQERVKIEDFLLSEIDDENLQETIDFINSDNETKIKEYKDILYEGDQYEGVFLEGNQYLLSNTESKVLIIDVLSEEHGVDKSNTRVQLNRENFIDLIKNRKEVIDCIRNMHQQK
ncbi:hypothetical protein [Enterococcus ureasiticus]|uniref:Uncharacterized protein n=1 Tax=Enterococcus ureasiticus TaxID=903984 RepID=A0A1E5GH21_9ENTE|nr:hypothetical protein [Enterococcus ureasiticus]OEG12033.1 hypothetical protein BCR21_07290 [Enterococcus ureasiticus]